VQRRRGDFLQNPQGLNLQRRKNTKYTFAPANRPDSAPLSVTPPIVEEIIKGKDRKKKVTTCYSVSPVLVNTRRTPEKHLLKGDDYGHKKRMQRQSLLGADFVFFCP